MISDVQNLDDLRALYPLISEGYSAISRKTSTELNGIDADVYRLIANGDLKAVVIEDETRVWGWVTYCVNKTLAGHIEGTFVDMYIRPGAPASLFNEAVDYIEKEMRASGATVLTFQTTRLGFTRRLNNIGYKLASYTFVKRVKQ